MAPTRTAVPSLSELGACLWGWHFWSLCLLPLADVSSDKCSFLSSFIIRPKPGAVCPSTLFLFKIVLGILDRLLSI